MTVVHDAGGEATHLSRWSGLGKESPVVAGVFAVLLLGMAASRRPAGLPEWAVFTTALAGGAWPLVVTAVLFSVVAAFFYVRVIVLCTSPTRSAGTHRGDPQHPDDYRDRRGLRGDAGPGRRTRPGPGPGHAAAGEFIR